MRIARTDRSNRPPGTLGRVFKEEFAGSTETLRA